MDLAGIHQVSAITASALESLLEFYMNLPTDGPDFMSEEPLETLSKEPALPPFLEGQRVQIESKLRSLSL